MLIGGRVLPIGSPMASNPGGERRLGDRREAVGRVGWRPPIIPSWRNRRRERNQARVALVEDVSVTGAKLVVPRTEGVAVGAIAAVEADGHQGTVEIRWINDHDDDTLVRVGVEFRQLSEALRQRINDLVAEDRKEDVDWRWEIAR
jgi:c-di-GMP-binding flagellar brake protein YcgR